MMHCVTTTLKSSDNEWACVRVSGVKNTNLRYESSLKSEDLKVIKVCKTKFLTENAIDKFPALKAPWPSPLVFLVTSVRHKLMHWQVKKVTRQRTALIAVFFAVCQAATNFVSG
jgi:hypothetical protein